MSWIFGEKKPVSTAQTNTDRMQAVFDDILSFNFTTFGPGMKTEGILRHLEKEIDEIRRAPDDIVEWADAFILLAAGAQRRGFTLTQIVRTMEAKMRVNRARSWPPISEQSDDEPVLHVKGPETVTYRESGSMIEGAVRVGLVSHRPAPGYGPGALVAAAAGGAILATSLSAQDAPQIVDVVDDDERKRDETVTGPVPVYDYAPPHYPEIGSASHYASSPPPPSYSPYDSGSSSSDSSSSSSGGGDF